MSSVKDRNSKCELLLRRELWRRGYRYRLHCTELGGHKLVGRPDLVFLRPRLIVFVDGDFWHGRTLLTAGLAALRRSFRPGKRQEWVRKSTENVRRDKRRSRELSKRGWRVIRLWESDVLRDVQRAADVVERAISV